MFDEIVDLESIHKQKCEISERELKLSAPKLNDLKLIPTIYTWFCEFHNSGHYKNNVVQLRKQFVFIILYLYFPQKLACGGRMLNGLRDTLSDVIGLSAKTIISNDSNRLIVDYRTYKDFQTSVDQAYTFIMGRLEESNVWVIV